MFGAYALESGSSYWKSADKGDAESLRQFFLQLMARAEGRTLAIVLDNVSYHNAKRVRGFLSAHPNLKLFPLPTYSPEYNPTEQGWRWSKHLVHAARTINGGADEPLSRFRKLMRARINGLLATPLNVGVGIWSCLCWIFMRICLERAGMRRNGDSLQAQGGIPGEAFGCHGR